MKKIRMIGKGGNTAEYAITDEDYDIICSTVGSNKLEETPLLTKRDYSYFEIRDLAWQFLIKNQVSRLPIDLHALIKNNNWIVVDYTNPILNLIDKEKRYRNKISTSYDIGTNYVIAYRNNVDYYRMRYAIAHEIGHIILLHFKYESTQYERETQMFAARILIPIIVLKALNVDNPSQIAELCQVSLPAAKKRHERLIMLNERNKFLTSPLEQKLSDNFREYINETRGNNLSLK